MNNGWLNIRGSGYIESSNTTDYGPEGHATTLKITYDITRDYLLVNLALTDNFSKC